MLLASLAVLLVGMAVIGLWAGKQAEQQVLDHLATTASLYVNSVIGDHVASLTMSPQLGASDVVALDRLVRDSPFGQQVAAFKVWTSGGQIAYSPNPALIGRQYPMDDNLIDAFRGRVTADISDLHQPENEYERQHWHRLLEVYTPVHDQTTGKVIGVVEFYQLPVVLDREVRTAQLQSWGVVGAVMLAMYALLAGIVKRGSDTIGRQEQALTQQVATLSALLADNQRLQERVHQAAQRTTLINERSLRRISADLHDGPAQALGLALLRLDGFEQSQLNADPASGRCDDFAVVQGSVREALEEIRTISAGLRLPALKDLSPADLARRAVATHQRRTAADVALSIGELPTAAPLPIKIALYRALQESLSNATRHADAAGLAVRLEAEAGALVLTVSDTGPGFDPATATGDDHLGLAGMREQAELLGGRLTLTTQPGAGTWIQICWPLRPLRGAADG